MSVFRGCSRMAGLFTLFQSQSHIKNILFSSGIMLPIQNDNMQEK